MDARSAPGNGYVWIEGRFIEGFTWYMSPVGVDTMWTDLVERWGLSSLKALPFQRSIQMTETALAGAKDRKQMSRKEAFTRRHDSGWGSICLCLWLWCMIGIVNIAISPHDQTALVSGRGFLRSFRLSGPFSCTIRGKARFFHIRFKVSPAVDLA